MAREVKSSEKPTLSEIADQLHSTAIHLLRRVRREDAKSGVGPAQLSALSVLVFGGPMTLGELAAVEQVKPPTMTRIVAGLERSLLAERAPDDKDGRRSRIHATSKGIRLLQDGRERRIEHLAAYLRHLSAGELVLLSKAVEILQRALQDQPD